MVINGDAIWRGQANLGGRPGELANLEGSQRGAAVDIKYSIIYYFLSSQQISTNLLVSWARGHWGDNRRDARAIIHWLPGDGRRTLTRLPVAAGRLCIRPRIARGPGRDAHGLPAARSRPP